MQIELCSRCRDQLTALALALVLVLVLGVGHVPR